ncbi:MAG: hypothetical protein DRJ42_18485 [Deltaproteobacteria bacterium]|nr:MAG: hypothetical protein DRJ42_18485 [Deltaproteobacteria bacterium]
MQLRPATHMVVAGSQADPSQHGRDPQGVPASVQVPESAAAPVSEAPVSVTEVSEAPVSPTAPSEVPVSEAPVSAVPVSEVPVSEAPPSSPQAATRPTKMSVSMIRSMSPSTANDSAEAHSTEVGFCPLCPYCPRRTTIP